MVLIFGILILQPSFDFSVFEFKSLLFSTTAKAWLIPANDEKKNPGFSLELQTPVA